MRRFVAAALACYLSVAVPFPAAASDVPYGVRLDGRRLDVAGQSGLLHDGVVYVDVVRIVKGFDGLLTFAPGGVVRVTIGIRTLDFRVGRRTAVLDGKMEVHFRGAPFVLRGVTYVPLGPVAKLGTARLRIDPARHLAYLVSLNSQALTPVPSPDAGAGDDVLPSPAQALKFTQSVTVDASGLHARVDIANTLPRRYAVSFPTNKQVAFVAVFNGSEAWNSSTSTATTSTPSSLQFAANETKTFTATWPGYNKLPPGRCTLHVRLLTEIPLDSSPLSVTATPAPSPS